MVINISKPVEFFKIKIMLNIPATNYFKNK